MCENRLNDLAHRVKKGGDLSIQAYYFWFIIAFIFFVTELVTGTFYFLIGAVALIAGGIAAALGMDPQNQVLIATVVAASGLFIVQRWKMSARQKAEPDMPDLDIGNQVKVEQKSENGPLRVRYRGAQWDAELESSSVSLDEPLVITGRRGNLLVVANKNNQ